MQILIGIHIESTIIFLAAKARLLNIASYVCFDDADRAIPRHATRTVPQHGRTSLSQMLICICFYYYLIGDSEITDEQQAAREKAKSSFFWVFRWQLWARACGIQAFIAVRFYRFENKKGRKKLPSAYMSVFGKDNKEKAGYFYFTCRWIIIYKWATTNAGEETTFFVKNAKYGTNSYHRNVYFLGGRIRLAGRGQRNVWARVHDPDLNLLRVFHSIWWMRICAGMRCTC